MNKHIALRLNNTDQLAGYIRLNIAKSQPDDLSPRPNTYAFTLEQPEQLDGADSQQTTNAIIELIPANENESLSDKVDHEFTLAIENQSQDVSSQYIEEINGLKAIINGYEDKLGEIDELKKTISELSNTKEAYEDRLSGIDELKKTISELSSTKEAYEKIKIDFDDLCEQLVNRDSTITDLQKELEKLRANNIEANNNVELETLRGQLNPLTDENKALNEQIQNNLNSTQETDKNFETEDAQVSQNALQLEIQNLKDQLNNKEQELQEAKDKAAKTSLILTQSLDKFKNKESALKKSLEDIEDLNRQTQQQSNEISELKAQLHNAVQNSSSQKSNENETETLGQMDDDQRDVFANMVQLSLDKLKIVSKILNSKNPKAGVVSGSLEKLKASVVEKRNEEDSLAEFEKKLKTHFWNIHEVYLSILAKQTKKTENFNEEIDQIRTQSNKSTHKLNYIEDLVHKFIKLDTKDGIHKDIIMAILDVFINKPEEKTMFIKNLKVVQ